MTFGRSVSNVLVNSNNEFVIAAMEGNGILCLW